MLRDDGIAGGGRRPAPLNVLGEPLEICLVKPMTGFYRDGCCNTRRGGLGQSRGLRRGDFCLSGVFQIAG
jgi:uncharacterized protein